MPDNPAIDRTSDDLSPATISRGERQQAPRQRAGEPLEAGGSTGEAPTA